MNLCCWDAKTLPETPKKLVSNSGHGGCLLALGMPVTRDHEILSLSQAGDIWSVLVLYGMTKFNPVHAVGIGPEVSLEQPDKSHLDQEVKELYRFLRGSPMDLVYVAHYGILFGANQPAKVMSTPSKVHLGAARPESVSIPRREL